MSDAQTPATPQPADALEGGNYDVIRTRLSGLGDTLHTSTAALNDRREGAFGSTELAILGNERVRTENNCVPVDIVQVGGELLFGYNVHIGLKRQITAADVLALQKFERAEGGFGFHAVQEESKLEFLTDRTFVREFGELYQYYKDARLIQLRVTETKLLAVFQTGATARDVKVLRWAVDPDGTTTYIDSRGERDHVFPPTHDFEWTATTREDHVRGRHPHVNVLDLVFVETVGGDLTIKVDNNTEDGEGIYSEAVNDPNQSLDDATIHYARRGALVLLKVRPYREEAFRYLVYNINTRHVLRIDTIGHSCVSLPEDHGILFPGGYYLRDGEYKVFEQEGIDDLEFVRAIHAPNGEDVMYVFHRRDEGQYALYPYNLIRKEVATPIQCSGYSLFEDGTLVVFRATPEPTRVHPMQVWQTPFMSPEAYEAAPTDDSLLGRIGNKELVRGISDAFTLVRLTRNQEPTRAMYEELVGACNRFADAYYWAADAGVGNLRAVVEDVRRTAELIIDEFIKVQTLKARAKEVLRTAKAEHAKLLTDVRTEYFKRIDEFLGAMTALRTHRGHLITLKETRYVDLEVLDALEAEAVERFDKVSRDAIGFLEGDAAFEPLRTALDALLVEIEAVSKATELAPLTEQLDTTSGGVNLLAEVVAGIEVEDPTRKTVILDQIGEVFSHANRVRAVLTNRTKELRTAEGRAEFVAQFKLFGQSVQSALALCDSPEACDDQLSKLLLQLEELEARFGDFDEFLPDLADKRDEVYQAFSGRKQTLVDERNRRIDALMTAANRIVQGVQRRSRAFKAEDELNTYFASDPMVLKLGSLGDQLDGLGDSVKAEELRSKLKSAKQDALRGLRDKIDLFDGDSNLVRFGKHRFSVNTQPLEMTLVPKGDAVALHLTGTDFHQSVDDPEFAATRPYWSQTVISETSEVYRSEYLAYCLLSDAEAGRAGLSIAELEAAVLQEGRLLETVRTYAANRYEEGYDRGIHDADAVRILQALVGLRKTADLLRFPSTARTLATLYWAFCEDKPAEGWVAQARSLAKLRDALGLSPALTRFVDHLTASLTTWHADAGFDPDGSWVAAQGALAGQYLFEVLARQPVRFVFGQEAAELRDGLLRWLEDHGGSMRFEDALRPLADRLDLRFTIKQAWLETFAQNTDDERYTALAPVAAEAATMLLVGRTIDADVSGGTGATTVEGLLGQHPRVVERRLDLRLSEFVERLQRFDHERVPGFRDYRERRTALVEHWRTTLRVDEFQPKVMTAFVRNKLISDVYLHLVGDNLAKQMGASGAGKRTDLMGLLLLISPPGYGKTTLMEYIASRLGLVFVKVNGPALGHSVESLDPSEAPNATARQEVEKVNLALEMGNNVMLYLDDIQHTNPEFLQKFISLCDASRRIEGVWNGRTRTYDLRGKKFAVVMAGNPYTETGDKFQIPDMLANRADTYNLGDVLGGREDVFALSFLENGLTSNPALQPLAARPQKDVYTLIRMAAGEEISPSELSHDYSAVELNEIRGTFAHLFTARDVLLKVNAEYIRSAAMEDAFRTEPRFQLQGSYRNMNKLAEKIVPALTPDEVLEVISDHYRGEAQTLTTGAEYNLLRLAELRGLLTDEEAQRLGKIREEYRRRQLMGGGDDDPVARVTGVLSGMAQNLVHLGDKLTGDAVPTQLARLDDNLTGIRDALTLTTGGASQELAGIREVLTSGAGTEERLAGLVAALSTIATTLEARPALELDKVERGIGFIARHFQGVQRGEIPGVQSMVEPLQAIHQALAQSGGGSDATLTDVLHELRGLRTALQERAAAPAAATLPPGPTPVHRSMAESRQKLLGQAQRALNNDIRPVDAGDDSTLAAALSVVEILTVHMAASAKARLPAELHDAFVSDLRRSVASAVADLASGSKG
ncbi:MAG: hypothetical protein ACI8PZ_000908 [Myxococcota bacterium]|jgi:hypothetical protein